MNDNEFWVVVWKCLATVVCIAILTIGGCTANKHRIIGEAIRAGSDPLLVGCAIDDLSDVCKIVASKRGQQ